MDEQKPKAEDITPVKFKLAREHVHAGETYKAGDTITLRKSQAERLEKAGTGKVVHG